MSISTFAKKAQIALDTASNGLEAIQKIKENSYNFVLMDLLMPEMDGKKATAEIKAIPGKESTKIVAMSAGKFRKK
jgi:CheY-like chemotaxis protein